MFSTRALTEVEHGRVRDLYAEGPLTTEPGDAALVELGLAQIEEDENCTYAGVVEYYDGDGIYKDCYADDTELFRRFRHRVHMALIDLTLMSREERVKLVDEDPGLNDVRGFWLCNYDPFVAAMSLCKIFGIVTINPKDREGAR